MSEIEHQWKRASEMMDEMEENNKHYTDFSKEEQGFFEERYGERKFFPFIQANLRLSEYCKLFECGNPTNCVLREYASSAQTYNITDSSQGYGANIYCNLDSADISALDIKTKEILGIDPKAFVHNCTTITPDKKENKEWFRKTFDAGVEQAETIMDLLRLNNSDFRKIPDFLAHNRSYVYNHRGSSRLWFGQKGFYVYRNRYTTKFLELADKATFEELWFAVECFSDCRTYNPRSFRPLQIEAFEKCRPGEAKSSLDYSTWLEYLKYHKTKRRIAEGLPLKWILPLDQKCMEEIIRKALLKTNFEECLLVYKTRIVGSLKVQILERLSDLASTPEEHFTVASIAHKKGEPFNNVWKKHIILSAKALKAKG